MVGVESRTETIESILDEYSAVPDGRYFHGHPEIDAHPQDYLIVGINSCSDQYTPPTKVMFQEVITPYGLLLRGKRKEKTVDAAVLGFQYLEDSESLECIQIQGGRDRWAQLTPIKWDRLLLKELITFGKRTEISMITVPVATNVIGGNPENYERLHKRYDQNARSHGFRYSHTLKQFVLEL